MPFSKEELLPHARRIFEGVTNKLPEVISSRLKCSRTFTTHGTRKTQYVFEIWDKFQNGVLPKSHFKYCVVYDYARLNSPQHDGYFHLWLNTVRIYRERERIRPLLERKISEAAPKGFKLEFVEDRAISCGKVFSFPNDLKRLDQLIAADLTTLIGAIHPILIPIIDEFSVESLTSKERHAEVKRRGKIPISRKGGPLDREKVRQYTRSIPPSWRINILEEAGYKCRNCGTCLKLNQPHIDHIVPFSKGGDTVLINLQALCSDCNLKKGNREAPVVTVKRTTKIRGPRKVVVASSNGLVDVPQPEPLPIPVGASRPETAPAKPSGFLGLLKRIFL